MFYELHQSMKNQKEIKMKMVKRIRIRSYETGFYFRESEFQGLLDQGRYWFVDPLDRVRIDVVSRRKPGITHQDLDVLVRSKALDGRAEILDLKDQQRALVWIDGRFDGVLEPGLHALWSDLCHICIEVVDASPVRFIHRSANVIAQWSDVSKVFNAVTVDPGYAGVYFCDGEFVEILKPGQYLFWKQVAKVKVFHVDLRERVMDVGGQEIMTADKVTLRLNAMVCYRVTDAFKSVSVVDDCTQAIYREAQLALRSVIGTYALDALLSDKEIVADALEVAIRQRAAEFGVSVMSLGIRDVILPGEMKVLMNKVIEARKAADANLIMRREETAAMRSQANTARLLDNNPTLMRLRELDVLEKVADHCKLNVVLGEKGLADRIVNLL
jgi:regulator of protease activity HflC (stomatin/prohibitin superfamily)